MKSSTIARKIREQTHRFLGELSLGFSIPTQRFIGECLYGIQARQSVKLTEIGRSLEEKIPLKKTEDRLSRQLSREGLWEEVTEGVLRLGAKKIQEDSLLVLDLSDLTKPYAKEMEYLAEVRDGDTGRIGLGYWTCQVVGARTEKAEIVPLYKELYSQEAPEFESENDQILKAIRSVRRHTKNGIWVVDRGADRYKLYHPLLKDKERFIIRLRGDRHLIFRGRPREAKKLAYGCSCPYTEVVIKEVQHQEKVYHLTFGFRRVKLPGRKEELYLVVVHGFGQEPMMLLTNLTMKKNRSVLWNVVQSYLTRWRIEETIRFIKQSYRIEDIRLLTYQRLKNMIGLVLATAYFACVYLGARTKLKILANYVLRSAKRLFGIPDFRYYAIADGIKNVLSRHNPGPVKGLPPPQEEPWLFAL